VKLVGFADEHDNSEVVDAPRVTLVGVRLQMRAGSETIAERTIIPASPFDGATVIVELPLTPVLTTTLAGDAVNVKSLTV
jgi:hypothetical protein